MHIRSRWTIFAALIAAAGLFAGARPAQCTPTTGNYGLFRYTATADLDAPAPASEWHTMGGPGANVSYSTGSSRDIYLENRSSSQAT
jgi:hypothetical protein